MTENNDLPLELEVEHYRRYNFDLRYANDSDLIQHYLNQGRLEGRQANRLRDKKDFVSLIPNTSKVLEIGPFDCPVVTGSHVSYADYLDQDDMKDRARLTNRNPETVPYINHVLSRVSLGDIDVDFDAVISCHCIEHQPDFIKHLQDVYNLIKSRNGRYFLLVPDKRYCYDRFIAESTIAEIVDAHLNEKKGHSLKSVIEHRALTTHNDSLRHWMEPQYAKQDVDPEVVSDAIKEWKHANGEYIDVHAWFFTPQSFSQNISLLGQLGMIDLEVERLFPTRYGTNEFWAVLKCMPSAESLPDTNS